MNKIFKKIIYLTILMIVFTGFASTAFAQTPLDVTFDPNPLFEHPNFLPLDETSGTVTVTNNSGTTQTILTEAINIFDNDNFGSLLYLKITENGSVLFDDYLSDFLSTAGEVSLGTITSGQSRTFIYTISFIDSSDNTYQGKTLGFDVCVGFEGGQSHCGDTVIGDEEDTDNGGGGGGGGIISGGGGGGGGNGSPSTSLIIFNERTDGVTGGTEPLPTATALITWNTNLLSTSQVVYGPNTETYTFNINTLPAFGYPSYTIENTTKVVNHSVLLTGLIPGQTYVYRVVSRASPPTVSFEHQFTVPLSGSTGGDILAVNTEGTGGAGVTGSSEQVGVLGTGEKESNLSPESTQENESVAEALNKNLAAVFASGFGGILSVCSLMALLVLILVYLFWALWLRKKYEKNNVPEEQIKRRFFAFICLACALAMIILFILGQYCPIPVFLVVFIVCLCVYLYKKIDF